MRQEEDVTKEVELKAEVLMEMYQTLHQQCIDLSSTQAYDRHYQQFKRRQTEVKA